MLAVDKRNGKQGQTDARPERPNMQNTENGEEQGEESGEQQREGKKEEERDKNRDSGKGNDVLPMIIIRVPENYILVISQPAARSSSYDTVAEREVEQSGAEREIDGETVGIMRSFRGLKRHENPKRRRDDGK